MPQAVTRTRKSIKSSESSVWLAYDRTGFVTIGNSPKSQTGLHGSPKRPHGNASASPKNSREVDATAGTIVETLDYYPFGATRIDNTTSSFSGENRKYIDQIFDSATQLYYDNARYQNPTQGQFISQDPMFLGDQSQQDLTDPQSLNAYSYAEDNPIVKKDPSGKIVELVAVRAGGTIIGVHEYVLITNSPAQAAQLTGVPSGVSDPTRITLSGEPSLSGFGAPFSDLMAEANSGADYANNESGALGINVVAPPAKYHGNELAFEDAVLGSFDSLPSNLGSYGFAGHANWFGGSNSAVPFLGGSNSNNVATTILQGAGVSASTIQGYGPSPSLTNRNSAPGLGTPVSNAGQASVEDQIRSLISSVQSLISSVQSFISGNNRK